jgi:hypothetical protein
MKSFFNNLAGNRCTGIYLGPDAAIAVTSSRLFRGWNIESASSQFTATSRANPVAGDAAIAMVKDNLAELMSRLASCGTLQLAFDDRYVRFFVLPLSEKPAKSEMDNILRWQAEKVLSNPSEYLYTAQLVEARSGMRLYGSAVSVALIDAVESVMQEHGYAWYMADSAVSYLWNDFAEESRQGAIAYISLGRYGWTLIACDANGSVELIKPGRWSYDADGTVQARSGMIEAHRLLTTFVDHHPQATPQRVYLDAGAMPDGLGLAKALFGDELVTERPPHRPVSVLANIPKQYSHELTIAMKASLLR